MALTYFARPPRDRDQTYLFYPTLDSMIPPEHPVRILEELADVCDFSAWEATYHGSVGQPPIPPSVIAKAWFYALSQGIRSSRKLEHALKHNVDFMWLAQGFQIDHVTLCNFRTRFKEPLKDLFRQIGKIAITAGLARLNEVTFDGTRVKSNNGRRETLTAAGWKERLAALEQQIDQFLEKSVAADAAEGGAGDAAGEWPSELADLQERQKHIQRALEQLNEMDRERRAKGRGGEDQAAQLPVTDPDSRVMPNKEGGYAPNYTPLTVVDTASGLILHADVVPEVNEHPYAWPAIEQVRQDFGVCPERLLTDGLNATGQNLATFESSGTELISPPPEGSATAEPNPAVRADPTQPVPETEWANLPRNAQHKLDRSCFVYDAEQDVHYCPQGRKLTYEETKPKVQSGCQKLAVRVYRCEDCGGCPLAAACLSARTVHGRTVTRDDYTEHRERHRQRMAEPAAKEAYRRRLHAGETPFAYIKQVLGLRQFLLRGLPKVETEWLWACTTHNLMKLLRHIGTQRTRSASQPVNAMP